MKKTFHLTDAEIIELENFVDPEFGISDFWNRVCSRVKADPTTVTHDGNNTHFDAVPL